jgi:threonine dehydrogenase-like Zn-dependent dehydrogenase
MERGFDTWVFSRGDAGTPNARLAESVGATYVSSAGTEFAALAKQIGRIDLVYEATGAPQLAFDVMTHLDANAVCVLTGVPGEEDPMRIDGDEMMKRIVLRNQVIVGTVNANRRDFGRAIRDLGRFDSARASALRGIITQRVAMDAFCEQATSRRGIKSVITLPGVR